MWLPGGVHAVVHLLLHVLPLQRLPAAQERHPPLVDLVRPICLSACPARAQLPTRPFHVCMQSAHPAAHNIFFIVCVQIPCTAAHNSILVA